MRRNISTGILLLGLATFLGACSAGGEDPGYEFAPNMYVGFGYEAMTQEADKPNTINPNGMNMRLPAPNTVARGQMDLAMYSFPLTNEGYEATAGIANPLETTPEIVAQGKTLYNINCTPCHGESGKGDGTIVAAGKFPPPPAYDSDRIKTTPDGKLFYSIRYGKNLMGAYGTTLTPEQIWKVVHYIRTVSGPYKSAATASK